MQGNNKKTPNPTKNQLFDLAETKNQEMRDKVKKKINVSASIFTISGNTPPPPVENASKFDWDTPITKQIPPQNPKLNWRVPTKNVSTKPVLNQPVPQEDEKIIGGLKKIPEETKVKEDHIKEKKLKEKELLEKHQQENQNHENLGVSITQKTANTISKQYLMNLIENRKKSNIPVPEYLKIICDRELIPVFFQSRRKKGGGRGGAKNEGDRGMSFGGDVKDKASEIQPNTQEEYEKAFLLNSIDPNSLEIQSKIMIIKEKN